MKEVPLYKSQQIALDILVEIDKICNQLNLKYCLIYGTLLGAVRHKGFIPWDDDIDIMMPRSDYEQLRQYFVQENSLKYKFYDFETVDQYPYMIGRISDERFIISTDNEKDYGLGVFVDIYPFDGLGNNYDEVVRFAKKGDRLSSLCFRSTRLHPIKKGNLFINIFEYILFKYSKLRGKKYFVNKLIELSTKYTYQSSEYVGCVTWLSGGEKDIFNRNDFDDLILHQFENYQFYIPKNYDLILKQIYGNYMQLPPKNQRIGHHFYKVYEKQKD